MVLNTAKLHSIDVLPRVGRREGKLVGSNSDDWSVASVKFLNFKWENAFDIAVDEWQAIRSEELRSWKPPEWVKVSIVGAIENNR